MVTEVERSDVAQLVDTLHEQVGLPFEHETAMPIMGIVALLYTVALVSGLIVLLPSIVKDLFILRVGKNLKRMWLDVHNVLGVFSLPFHLVIALTSVVFALHDEFYDTQDTIIYQDRMEDFWRASAIPQATPEGGTPLMQIDQLVARLLEQAPEFKPTLLIYNQRPDGFYNLRVEGTDDRHGVRTPTAGLAFADPYTGTILADDMLPGRASGYYTAVISFFTLHFGSFGGLPVRWAYFVLGLAGAFLFYSGNLLWIETRRKKARKQASVEQSRSTRVLGSLTVGVCLGSVAGISLTIAAAKWLPLFGVDAGVWHIILYYAIFLTAVGWAFLRGTAKGAVELLRFSALTTALIPLSSMVGQVAALPGAPWAHQTAASIGVDIVALVGVAAFLFMARRTRARIRRAPEDSIWYCSPKPA